MIAAIILILSFPLGVLLGRIVTGASRMRHEERMATIAKRSEREIAEIRARREDLLEVLEEIRRIITTRKANDEQRPTPQSEETSDRERPNQTAARDTSAEASRWGSPWAERLER